MKKLLYFEQRKIWNNISFFSIFFMVLFTIICSITFLGIDNKIVDNKGNIVSGLKIYKTMAKESKDITGIMNQKYLDKLLITYNKSFDKKYWGRVEDIDTKYVFPNYFINEVFYGDNNNDSKLNINPSIIRSEKLFYDKYKIQVKHDIKKGNLNRGPFKYTPEQLKFIDKKVNNIKTPLKVGYANGIIWFMAFYAIAYIVMIMVICLVVSTVFSKNGKNSIDDIYLATRLGRHRGMNIRFISGNIFILIVNIIFILTILVQNALIFSLAGFNSSSQVCWFDCTYNITIGTCLIILCLFGLLGSLIIGNLAMLISIKFKNNIISTLISLGVLGLLYEAVGKSSTILNMINPMYFVEKFSKLGGDYSWYIFCGNIGIPYWALAILLSIIYMFIIYMFLHREYKKYRVC